MTERGFLTIKGVAEWASVSPKTVQRWIASGLPAYQAGPENKVLIRPQDVEVFLTRKRDTQCRLDKLVNDALLDLGLDKKSVGGKDNERQRQKEKIA